MISNTDNLSNLHMLTDSPYQFQGKVVSLRILFPDEQFKPELLVHDMDHSNYNTTGRRVIRRARYAPARRRPSKPHVTTFTAVATMSTASPIIRPMAPMISVSVVMTRKKFQTNVVSLSSERRSYP